MLIRNATAIMTGLPGDKARASGSDIRIDRAGRIGAIGRLTPETDERVVDATNCVVYPGWVNTHHHLAQSVLKGIPQGINVPLMSWLESVPYRYRARFDPQLLELAAEIGIAQLLVSGCTTIADHHYVYWKGIDYDPGKVLFDVAARFGVRLVLCRGGSTLKRPFESPDSPPPETVDLIVGDVERLTAKYHDAGGEAMRRVVLAPPTPN
ncbi:MAG TPA: amidohydrolase family protein, partial [Burkholderiales bacterium]|nr:amidohydrolase family protein [Burkholderiales bacterium]